MSLSGDRRRLDRRERAQASIALAECPMPQLGLLLEGSPVPERRRKAEAPLSSAVREIFGSEPTPRQVEALRYEPIHSVWLQFEGPVTLPAPMMQMKSSSKSMRSTR